MGSISGGVFYSFGGHYGLRRKVLDTKVKLRCIDTSGTIVSYSLEVTIDEHWYLFGNKGGYRDKVIIFNIPNMIRRILKERSRL